MVPLFCTCLFEVRPKFRPPEFWRLFSPHRPRLDAHARRSVLALSNSAGIGRRSNTTGAPGADRLTAAIVGRESRVEMHDDGADAERCNEYDRCKQKSVFNGRSLQ